jgi:hypothetical protein
MITGIFHLSLVNAIVFFAVVLTHGISTKTLYEVAPLWVRWYAFLTILLFLIGVILTCM